MPTPLIEVRDLENHEPRATPEEIERAQEIMQAVIGRKLPLSSSVLSSVIISIMRRVFTTAIPTFAVQLAGDGIPMLLINPKFAVDVGEEGGVMIAVHEAYHLVMAHLLVDPMLKTNPAWTMATEASINFRMLNMFNTKSMPTVPDEKDPEPDPAKKKRVETGVNPFKVFADYKKAMKEAGLSPVDKIEDFYRTDLGCLAELSRLPKPPKPKQNFCVHMPGSGPGSGGGDPDKNKGDQPDGTTVTLDQDEVDRLVENALDTVLHEATANSSKIAKDELLKLMDATDDNERASKIWGDLGAGTLRGETTTTRKTDLWEKWTADALASRLAEGNRLRYAKKIPWDPRVTPHGKEPMRQGVVAIDASGSMHQEVLEKVAALIGDTENLEVTWVSFDGEVWPFEAGEPFKGGGGTNCQLVDLWIEDHYDDDPDFVLVITDGYFQHFTPRDPDAWIWLITSDGDAWPEAWNPPMSTRMLDI